MRKKLDKITKQDNEDLENMETTNDDSIHVDLQVIKKNAGVDKLLKDCIEAQKKYEECWEDQPIDESEENICDRCSGFLYIEQGGDIDDCPSCNGTGQNLPERLFNVKKFGEWVEENPFLGNQIPFYYSVLNTISGGRESGNLIGTDDKMPC